MTILFLAPQPFYQERGTPIAVGLLLQALSARGHAVDVLTYAEGEPVSYPGVRLHRIPRLPFTRGVGPGASAKKLICDAALLVAALGRASRRRYDLVHAVEESVFIALALRWLRGTPYIYDMDSSLSDQLLARYRWLGWLGAVLRWAERLAIRRAETVVPVCDALADVASAQGARRIVVLRDISLVRRDGADGAAASRARSDVGPGRPVVMYIGNLEPYQGIDLLLESFALAQRALPEARLVIIGGQPAAIARYQARAEQLGLGSAVRLLGPRPVADLAAYVEAADVLVSPRLTGGNTPMKIYSYLDAGRAVLATDLPTHTQVLTAEVAMLRAPEPAAFADGLVRLLRDEPLRRRLSAAGPELIRQRHSLASFTAAVASLYGELEARFAPAGGGAA
jgi:glycosyltransferase involved in cell wall biosynthesis